jgi:hypothetical protein
MKLKKVQLKEDTTKELESTQINSKNSHYEVEYPYKKQIKINHEV